VNSILWNPALLGGRSSTQNQWWGTKLVSVPLEEPVSLQTAKAQVRVDWDDEDDLITSYITAARQYCEDICGRAFVSQVWDLWLPQWPAGDRLYLPYPPVQNVVYVQYTDSTEATTIVDPTIYTTNTGGDLAEVVLRFGQIWPVTVLSPSRPINVRFTCGYGDADAVPATIKQAILLLMGHWYTNREAVVIGRTATASVRVQETLDALLARYRMPSYTPDPLRP
jgi:uncharacterized phiE125 gp8 family phage protein